MKRRLDLQGYDPTPISVTKRRAADGRDLSGNSTHLATHRIIFDRHGEEGIQISIGDHSVAFPDAKAIMWNLSKWINNE